MKKRISIILVIVLLISGAAVLGISIYLNNNNIGVDTSKAWDEAAAGKDPLATDCQSIVTETNSSGVPVSYCSNPSNFPAKATGKLYLLGRIETFSVQANGITYSHAGSLTDYTQLIDTGITVSTGDTIKITAPVIKGWRPYDDTKTSFYESYHNTNVPNIINYARTYASANAFTIISEQSWSDAPTTNNTWDFDDEGIVFIVKAGPSVTPTVTNTITPTSPYTVTPTTPYTVTPTTPYTVTPTTRYTATPTTPYTATPTTPPTTPVIPETALVNDDVDRVIIGAILIILGAFMYQSGAYIKIGKFFWDKGGKDIYSGTDSTVKGTKEKINDALNSVYNASQKIGGQISHTSSSLKKKLADQKLDPKSRFEKKIMDEREKKDS